MKQTVSLHVKRFFCEPRLFRPFPHMPEQSGSLPIYLFPGLRSLRQHDMVYHQRTDLEHQRITRIIFPGIFPAVIHHLLKRKLGKLFESIW